MPCIIHLVETLLRGGPTTPPLHVSNDAFENGHTLVFFLALVGFSGGEVDMLMVEEVDGLEVLWVGGGG